jgi:hypothetical protein
VARSKVLQVNAHQRCREGRVGNGSLDAGSARTEWRCAVGSFDQVARPLKSHVRSMIKSKSALIATRNLATGPFGNSTISHQPTDQTHRHRSLEIE